MWSCNRWQVLELTDCELGQHARERTRGPATRPLGFSSTLPETLTRALAMFLCTMLLSFSLVCPDEQNIVVAVIF